MIEAMRNWSKFVWRFLAEICYPFMSENDRNSKNVYTWVKKYIFKTYAIDDTFRNILY